jgi:hypothetical protein
MGLDICAFSNLISTTNYTKNEDGDIISDDYIEYINNEDGETSDYYTYDDCFSFRAGSYRGAAVWRGWLATIAGLDEKVKTVNNEEEFLTLPFTALIVHSHIGGSPAILAKTSAKLAKDFADFKEIARTTLPDNDDEGQDASCHEEEKQWFFDMYCEWQKAFELASNNGGVVFG